MNIKSSDRVRERQGTCRIISGAPCPDPLTTASLFPGVIVGEYLRRHLDLFRGRVLDLGAGNSPYAAWYSSQCDFVVTTDIAAHPGLSVITGAEMLPFEDGSFDVVLATEVLEHVTDFEASMNEIRRVLAPGGNVIITVPYFYPTHEPPHDHRRFTHHGLRASLEARDLTVADLTAKGGLPALVSNAVLMTICMALRETMLRSRSRKVGRIVLALLSTIERVLLSIRDVSPDFPRTASRVSLGYMAIAKLNHFPPDPGGD